jgi:deoxycytidylate deaminase
LSSVSREEQKNKESFLNYTYRESELFIGLVGAVGTKQKHIVEIITERLKAYNYNVILINVSKDVISKKYEIKYANEFERIKISMNMGNRARQESGDNSILALGVADEIMRRRNEGSPQPRTAYIINSLKHPKEVERLREIYSTGFFLFGTHSDEQRRLDYLKQNARMEEDEAKLLIERDMNEEEGHGQHTRDTFQMSDFFIHLERNQDQVEKSIWRILDLIFGHPYLTPTFDEYAMFMAFTSALRSADLSRQVGAVIAQNEEIIASGANDCPRAGGGLYWPSFDSSSSTITDFCEGRDYTRGYDSNKFEQAKIIDNIGKLLNLSDADLDKLKKSKIGDITEYGRVVHAEMETILMCARNQVSTSDAIIYCTTFPCHNCAKHIIAAGIKKVIYIEPYPKSKAFEFHNDSITSNPSDSQKVVFQPFVGIGPRRFFELFSMSSSSGFSKDRKDKSGYVLEWTPEAANMRTQLVPYSYLEKEALATNTYLEKWRKLHE